MIDYLKIHQTPLQDKYHYKAVFTSKDYDTSKDKDFLPPLPELNS